MSVLWYQMSHLRKMPSQYAMKMKRLSCKIFQEYYKPPMPIEMVGIKQIGAISQWEGIHIQNKNQIERQAALPFDLDPDRNPKYYPAHPQIRELMYTLRMHGLYR